MIWLTLLIPLIVSIVIYFYFNSINNDSYNWQTNKIEIFLYVSCIPVGFVAFVILITSLIMENYNQTDTEYLSYYISKIRHEDEWNEQVRVRKTRTYRDADGKEHEETYYVNETKYHPEKHIAYLNNDDKITISGQYYNQIKKSWNVPMKFIDMHRHYHTIDGDAQEYEWNNNKETIETYVIEHQYKNKIIGSQSAFKFNEITEKEAKQLGLYDYPELKGHTQNFIIGYDKFVSHKNRRQIQILNSLYGKDKEVTFFVLIYPNTTVSIVEDQRSYWQGGNKNEFVICVGVDSLTNNVQWAQCFSWLDDVTMEVECRDFIVKQKTFNINKLSEWLENHLELWKRKEFKDFDYLNVNLSDKQEIAIIITVIILSIIIGIIEYNILKEKINKNGFRNNGRF